LPALIAEKYVERPFKVGNIMLKMSAEKKQCNLHGNEEADVDSKLK